MRWIIGDVHGMLRPLSALLGAVRAVDGEARFIFVGDYVNRGPDARGVIDLLLTLDGAKFVRGNHDDIFDQVLHGTCYADNATRGDRLAAFQWFIKYGLDSTLASYGVGTEFLLQCAERPSEARLERIVERVPRAHRDFIRALPPVYEEADLFVVHGKWGPDDLSESPGIAEQLAAHPKMRHRLLWGRYTDDELHRAKAWGRTGYFGHTPVSYYSASYPAGKGSSAPAMLPVAGPKILLLDTAAALGEDGRLTAFCPDTRSFLQADHFGNMVAG